MIVKQRQKIQKRLGELVSRHGWGKCWVCGSVNGMKASRMAYKIRCSRCKLRGSWTEDAKQCVELRKRLREDNV
jgi:hypothetical protein